MNHLHADRRSLASHSRQQFIESLEPRLLLSSTTFAADFRGFLAQADLSNSAVPLNGIATCVPRFDLTSRLTISELSVSGRVASFVDAAGLAPSASAAARYLATINWGDGNSSPGSIRPNDHGGYDVWGTHLYAAAGTYELQISVESTLIGSFVLGNTSTCGFGTLASAGALLGSASGGLGVDSSNFDSLPAALPPPPNPDANHGADASVPATPTGPGQGSPTPLPPSIARPQVAVAPPLRAESTRRVSSHLAKIECTTITPMHRGDTLRRHIGDPATFTGEFAARHNQADDVSSTDAKTRQLPPPAPEPAVDQGDYNEPPANAPSPVRPLEAAPALEAPAAATEMAIAIVVTRSAAPAEALPSPVDNTTTPRQRWRVLTASGIALLLFPGIAGAGSESRRHRRDPRNQASARQNLD